MSANISRGIRNNNPGNIRKGAPWQGLAEDQNDSAFCIFKTPEFGIRAMAVTLITYQDKRRAKDGSKIDTLREIIERWAPATENNTEAYIKDAASFMKIGANGIVDVRQHHVMLSLVKAIIKHECGVQPYDNATINEGLRMAGIEVPAKPLGSSRTIKAGTVAAGATATSGILDSLSEAQGTLYGLVDYLPIARYVLLAIVLVSVGAMIWARVDDHVKARR